MSNGCGAGVGLLRVGCHSRLHLRPISLGGGGRSRASVSEGLMGDWWIIGDNAGLGCPSRVEFLAVWDNGDWYASDVERLRLTAGFCSSREARSAACSTAARRCINNLFDRLYRYISQKQPTHAHVHQGGVNLNKKPYLCAPSEPDSQTCSVSSPKNASEKL